MVIVYFLYPPAKSIVNMDSTVVYGTRQNRKNGGCDTLIFEERAPGFPPRTCLPLWTLLMLVKMSADLN